jgi:beta-phosphoglucomutase-like phosphatase (HAD superfamily)
LKYGGIIFSFNGVLLWDADLQVQSWQRMAQNLRRSEMSRTELATRMHGRTSADILAYLVGRPVEDKELADLIQTKEAFYREHCLMNSRRFVFSPGAADLLDWVAKHNIQRTIATSAEIVNLNFFIQHLRLDRWFDVEKIVYDDGIRPGKPAPDIYVDAARSIGVEPHWCIVVEDALPGIASAQAAGIGYIVALGAPVTHAQLLQQPGVSLAIKSLRDFPRERLLGLTGQIKS